MSHTIIPLIADGASDPVTFAAMARKVIQDGKAAAVFAGWTSASQKAKPILGTVIPCDALTGAAKVRVALAVYRADICAAVCHAR